MGVRIGCFLVLFLLLGCAAHEAAKEPLTIGALLPLSGRNAVYGEELRNAIELARAEINAQGGINSRELRVVYEDDQANPAYGTRGMRKLVDVERVPVVLGSWASGVVIATAPIAEENEVIVMASALSPAITRAGDYIFRMQPSATFYAEELAGFASDAGYSRAAILFVNNEFGRSLEQAFSEAFTQKGGRVVASEAYEQSDSDFRVQLTKAKAADPDSVFLAGYQEMIDVIRQAHEMGIDAQILANPAFESESSIEALGELAEGVLYPYHYAIGESAAAREYEQHYLAAYDVPTGGFAPLMYDGTNIVAEALRFCGTDTGCIKEYLYNVSYEGVTGTVTFDEYGDPTLSIVIKTVHNGTFVLYR